MGRLNLSDEDMPLIIRLAFDSAPGHRAALFRELIAHSGELRTSQIEEFLHCSNPTALKEMKTFCILGICEEINGDAISFSPENSIRLKEDLQWFLSEECKQILSPPNPADPSKEI